MFLIINVSLIERVRSITIFFHLQELKNVKRKAKWICSLADKIAQNQHITEQQYYL